MDMTRFSTGTFTITKPDPATVNISLQATTPKTCTDTQLYALWNEARAEILSDPSVAGLTHDEKNEDVSLGLQKHSINARLRFLATKS